MNLTTDGAKDMYPRMLCLLRGGARCDWYRHYYHPYTLESRSYQGCGEGLGYDVPLQQQLGTSVCQPVLQWLLCSCACLSRSSECDGTFAHCLRLTECTRDRMEGEATTLAPTGWSFVVRQNGGTDPMDTAIQRLHEQALCAVRYLIELRDRLPSVKTMRGSGSERRADLRLCQNIRAANTTRATCC
jgi:hypothetical protein